VHRSKSRPFMSALGHKRKLVPLERMSGLPPKADIGRRLSMSAKGQKPTLADQRRAGSSVPEVQIVAAASSIAAMTSRVAV